MKRSSFLAMALGAGLALAAGQALAADLVVYDSLDFAASAVKAFTAKTGIKVDLVEPGSTGETLGKIAAEGDHPQFDVVWLDGSAIMERMLEKKVLQPIPADLYAGAKYTDLGKSLIPADHSFLPTTVSTTAIEVDTKKVPAGQYPKSWADMAKFAGSVAAKDPNLSGPAYQWLVGLFQTNGIDSGKALLAKILTNKAISGFASGGRVDKELLTGLGKVAINQDSGIFAKRAKGEPLMAIYPTEGSVALPSAIGVSAATQRMDAVRKFIAFVTSAEGQAAMSDGTDTDFFFIPIIDGVKAKPGRETNIKFVVLDNKAASAHETEWKRWYKRNFVP